jgi:hypothetical protein
MTPQNYPYSYLVRPMPNPRSERRQWQIEDGAGRLIDDNYGWGFTIEEADRAIVRCHKRDASSLIERAGD